jgi:phosphatidylserine/phosphatidylglycerophosphate/cardiolipin synthase-like enzyme
VFTLTVATYEFHSTTEGTSELPGFNTFQEEIWSALQRHPNAATKLRGYTRSDQVYIHSKTTVIDDIYISTGSPNRNIRSMTLDSEIAIAAIDPTPALVSPDVAAGTMTDARQQARALRLRLWNDHAQLGPTVSPAFAQTTVAEGVALLDQAMGDGILLRFNP